jgi:hypothetical protein
MLMAAPVNECLQLAYPDVYDLGGTGGSWGSEEAGKVSRVQVSPKARFYSTLYLGLTYT